jgi:pectinesterase
LLQGYSCFAVEYRLSPSKYPAAILTVKRNYCQFIKDNAAKFNVDTAGTIFELFSGGQMAALVRTTNDNKILRTEKFT